MSRLTTATHWGAYEATVKDGKLTGLSPLDPADDVARMTESMIDAVDAPSRIRRPAARKSWLEDGPGTRGDARGVDPYVEISWDEALYRLAQEIERVRGDFGNEAIFAGSYGWASAGRFHHAQSQLHRFYNMAGGYTRSVNAYSFAAAEVILPHVITDLRHTMRDATSWHEIAEYTDVLVAFGGLPLKNAQIQNGICGSHTTRSWMEKIGAGKTQSIGITPLRDDMEPCLNAEWVPVRPNTDLALMLALAHGLEMADKVDRAFLDRYAVGYDRFRPYLLGESDGVPKTAEWASEICGVSVDQIQRLTDALASAQEGKRVLISLSWSLQRADRGEHVYWMGVILSAMLGQIGMEGAGIAIGLSAEHGQGNPDPQVNWAAVPPGDRSFNRFIPVARISDMLLNPGGAFHYNGQAHTYPDVKLVHWAGGNPFHHHQDINRLRQALHKPDTIVVNEIYWTSMARHADLVLPVTSTLERNDIAVAQLDGWAVAMKQAVPPVGEARDDFAIFSAVAGRLGFEEAYTEGRDVDAWLRDLWNRSRQEASRLGHELPSFDDFWEEGALRLKGGPEIRRFLGPFRDDPEANPLGTPSGKIEIYSETIEGFGEAGIGGHPTWDAPYEWLGGADKTVYPLHLISNQPRTRLHSQLDAGAGSRGAKIKGREPMRINPVDAAARGLKDGDVVRVHNDRGACLAGVRIDEDVMQGVIELATGAWYDPAQATQPVGLDVHGNPNVLTADRGTSVLSQGPSAHTCLVEVSKFDGDPPPIRVFDPPTFVTQV